MSTVSQIEFTEFAKAVCALAITFNQPMDEHRIDAWWIALNDVDPWKLKTAIIRAQRECRFMPSPAELRELSGELTAEQRAAVAYSAIRGKLGRDEATLDCDDPVVLAVIRAMGGRKEVAHRMSYDAGWCFKDFTKVYSLLFAAGVAREQAERIPGTVENRWLLDCREAQRLTAVGGCDTPEPPKPQIPLVVIRTGLPPVPKRLLRDDRRPPSVKSIMVSSFANPRIDHSQLNGLA